MRVVRVGWTATCISLGQYNTGLKYGCTATGYNRGVRIVPAILLTVCLAGCNRGVKSNEGVRQGVLDYLATKGMTPAAMDINVT